MLFQYETKKCISLFQILTLKQIFNVPTQMKGEGERGLETWWPGLCTTSNDLLITNKMIEIRFHCMAKMGKGSMMFHMAIRTVRHSVERLWPWQHEEDNFSRRSPCRVNVQVLLQKTVSIFTYRTFLPVHCITSLKWNLCTAVTR